MRQRKFFKIMRLQLSARICCGQPEAASTGVVDFPLCQVMEDHDEAGFHYVRVVTVIGPSVLGGSWTVTLIH